MAKSLPDHCGRGANSPLGSLHEDSAEIRRLRAEAAQLAEALREIACADQDPHTGKQQAPSGDYCVSRARRALSGRLASDEEERCPKCGGPSWNPPAEVYCVECATEGYQQDAEAHRQAATRERQADD